MADREKVINGLEHCSDKSLCNDDCSYSSILRDPNFGVDECTTQLAHDALKLLKEKEKKIVELEEKQRQAYECGRHDGIEQYLREREEYEEWEWE